MKTGFRGTFVISWTQTEIDGLEAAPVSALDVGAAWSWRGEALRVDGPSDLLRLDMADGEKDLQPARGPFGASSCWRSRAESH